MKSSRILSKLTKNCKKATKVLSLLSILSLQTAFAQEETSDSTASDKSLTFSGSVDTYYKFSNRMITTSFANENNTLALGMFNLAATQKWGKASFVGDVSFGPRSGQSIPVGDTSYPFYIQNLYVSYDLTDKLSVTGGYMGTFVGYEVISPKGNFNYSTSYLFTNGPFQHAGIKLNYSISEKFAVMAGLFNNWNVYSQNDNRGMNDLGIQFFAAPVEGLNIYLNSITSLDAKGVERYDSAGALSVSGQSHMEVDLTATYQATEKLKLGLNAAYYGTGDKTADLSTTQEKYVNSTAGFHGAALYAQYSINDWLAAGIRYENFTGRGGYIFGVGKTTMPTTPKVAADYFETTNLNAITFSLNATHKNLRFIPEVRYETSNQKIYGAYKAGETPSSSAFQFLFGAVYGF
jgi:hypothetical protein